MSITRLTITDFMEGAAGALLIDVRSPGEYSHGCIPGAINIPLFTDEERKVVGTTYKQKSREQAIKTGLDYFGPKMRGMVEEVEKLVKSKMHANERSSTPKKEWNVLVYCWRGGMRSGGVAWLLDLYGFKTVVLSGGYKAFRNHVLHTFQQPFRFNVLGGYTGSGKTELLQALKDKGEHVIDLEDLAKHKGSAFGSINMPEQPTQEMFENLLAMELQTLGVESPVWIEDESQRIGRLNLPHSLWNTIRQCPVIFLDIPFEKRLAHIVAEYGSLDKDKLAEAIVRIAKRLGGLHTQKALEYLSADRITECFFILLTYYDKHYLKSLHNRENIDALLTTIACDKPEPTNTNLLIPALT